MSNNKYKYTLGPWKIEHPESEPYEDIRVSGLMFENANHRTTVCRLWQDDAPVPEWNEMQRANAQLIATAPEMLEMCKSCAEDLAFSAENCDQELRQQLLSVIAKAEGRL